MPIAGDEGYHADDWEGTQVRVGPGGHPDARATSHHGYNYQGGRRNWGSDAGIAPLRWASEEAGLRPEGGWGPATGWLFVSGGSHAGAVKGRPIRPLHPAPRHQPRPGRTDRRDDRQQLQLRDRPTLAETGLPRP